MLQERQETRSSEKLGLLMIMRFQTYNATNSNITLRLDNIGIKLNAYKANGNKGVNEIINTKQVKWLNGDETSSSSSSPLLSLVTSTSEISHQPVHTYTTYIQYDKGVDRTGRQGIEEKYSITWGRGGEKNNPRLCSLGSTVWEQEKHLSTKAHNQYTP